MGSNRKKNMMRRSRKIEIMKTRNVVQEAYDEYKRDDTEMLTWDDHVKGGS